MESYNELSQCKKCNMELPKEHIIGDECIFCESYKNKWERRDYEQKETELKKILDFYKSRHKDNKYDVLVPLSGGKDSTYVLYLAVKKYGLKPLAVTFNNGLQTQLARNNIQNAAEHLGVDHITVAPNPRELQAMYRHCFSKTRNMCMVCNHIINTTVLKTAVKENISLILVGGVGKLELAPIYGNKRYCMEEVFKSILDSEIDFDISAYLNKPLRKNNNIEFLSLFNYVDYDYNEVLKILKTELNWNESHHGDTKIDCLFHPVISYYKYLNNGVSSSILMSSALLRDNKISVDEYNKRTEIIKEQLNNTGIKEKNDFFNYLDIDENNTTPAYRVLDFVEPVITEDDFLIISKMKNNTNYNTRDLLEKLIEIIKPEVKRDGGDIKIVDFRNNELIIELSGDCRSCLQADDTMVPYIESIIRKFISKDISVERYIRME